MLPDEDDPTEAEEELAPATVTVIVPVFIAFVAAPVVVTVKS